MSESIQTVTSDGGTPLIETGAIVDANADSVVGSEPSAEPLADDTAPPKEPGKDETPPWLKAEVTKERNRRRAAEEEARQLKEQVDRLIKAVEPKREEQVSSKPKRDDFFDPDEYEAALTQWITETVTENVSKKVEEKTTRESQQQAQARQLEETRTAWSAQVETAKKAHPDFDEVVYADDFHCTPAMMNAIAADIHGAEVAYHLASNPDEAARVAALAPVQQIIEIGRLSATLLAKPAAVSRAPAPIRPLGNEAPAVQKSPADETEAEYMARRSAEAKANRERLY